jgi:hypothetical protein
MTYRVSTPSSLIAIYLITGFAKVTWVRSWKSTSPRTAALLTLTTRDVRQVGDDDLVSVRPSSRPV